MHLAHSIAFLYVFSVHISTPKVLPTFHLLSARGGVALLTFIVLHFATRPSRISCLQKSNITSSRESI